MSNIIGRIVLSFPKAVSHLPCSAVLASVLLLCVSTALAGEPKLVCDEPVFSFGNVEGSNSVEHSFVLWNRGDAPIIIGKLRGCCGATVAVSAPTIAPGSNTILKIVLSLAGANGEVRKSVYVASNDPKQPYLQVRLEGMARPPVLVEPGYLNFNAVSSNEALSAEVTITSLPVVPLRVTNVVSATGQFRAEVIVSSNRFCRIRVNSIGPLPQGVTRGSIAALTDNAMYPRLDISVLATVSSDILIVPQDITLLATTGKVEPVTRYLAIRSKRGVPFKILSVEAPDPGIEVKVDALSSGGYRIEMKNILPFSELDGKRFIIKTDHADGREISVPVRMTPASGQGK